MTKMISLMYHDVYSLSATESGFQNDGAIKYKISKKIFKEHIEQISIYCVNHFIEKKNILLTFDDGGNSFLTVIAPILEMYGFRGYFFITTKLINTPGFLTSEAIKQLDIRGHVIGTHSHTHPINISTLSDQGIEYEWVASLQILKDILKKSVEYASIPGGFFSSFSAKVLFSKGVNVIFTSNPSTSIKFEDTKMIIGRYSVTQGMTSREVLDILRPFSMIRIKLAIYWNMLNIAKLILGKNYFKLRNKLIKFKN